LSMGAANPDATLSKFPVCTKGPPRNCVVLEDCTAEPMAASLSRSNHGATIRLVERIFGSVSTSTDFIDALRAAEAIASR
jgi:hypothetical protein